MCERAKAYIVQYANEVLGKINQEHLACLYILTSMHEQMEKKASHDTHVLALRNTQIICD
jgi:hypothetical protein